MARPEIKIDLKKVEEVAQLHLTNEELATVMGVSVKTIERRMKVVAFRDARMRGEAKGKMSLRRAQMQNALKGNAFMQRWLGQQWLQQSDKQEQKQDQHVTVEYVYEDQCQDTESSSNGHTNGKLTLSGVQRNGR